MIYQRLKRLQAAILQRGIPGVALHRPDERLDAASLADCSSPTVNHLSQDLRRQRHNIYSVAATAHECHDSSDISGQLCVLDGSVLHRRCFCGARHGLAKERIVVTETRILELKPVFLELVKATHLCSTTLHQWLSPVPRRRS